MSEPVLDPAFWRQRLRDAQWPHSAVYMTSPDDWAAIEARHREVLAGVVHNDHSVLDVGCGWGRLLDLMPPEWAGDYHGVDLSPDFIRMAKQLHPERPGRAFTCGDVRRVFRGAMIGSRFDLAVLVSVRQMLVGNCGPGVWAEVEAAVRRLTKKVLYLEYDANDSGSLE